MTEGLSACLEPLEWSEVRRMVRDRAATILGQRAADRMAPSDDAAWVAAERELTVECARLLSAAGRIPFHAIQDPDPALARLGVEGVRLEAQEIYDLCLLLRNAEEIGAFLAAAAIDGEPPHRMAALAAALPDLTEVLREVADHVSASGQVVDSASPELRKIRRRIGHLSEKLQGELQKIIDGTRSDIFLRDEYITVRNGRYVLPIRTDSPIPMPGVLHGRSSTGLTHFVEPLATVEINNEIVALREEEEEEVDRILRRYTGLLRDRRDDVRITAREVGRIDLVQARALLAADLGCVAAEDGAGGALALDGARHPLLEESLAPLGRRPVPITVSLGGDYPVLIVSGPNTGGKTVALKTIGLLALMNQAGLLVPAAAARLPVFRSVLVDVGDHQSIAANLSTFSSHMQNIASMAAEVEPPALVLLDEIGTGTDPEEGAALGVAILRHFQAKGALVVVTTHMSRIKSHGYAAAGVKNACVEFDERTLQPTYRLLLGVAGSSSGIEIARRLGLPEAIVAEARDRIGPDSREADATLRRIQETLDEASRERERLGEERRALERLRARLEADAERMEKERSRRFRDELAAAVERYERTLRQHLAGIDDKALQRRLEKEGRRRAADVAAAVEREARRRFGIPGGPAHVPPAEVHPGDRVRIASLGQQGAVEEAAGDRVRVDVGGKTIAVPLADLVLLERARPGRPLLPRHVSLEAQARGPVGGELRLIGDTIDEALQRVDKFLDDAFLAGHLTVRLVHGHGTGALRRAIAGFLKDHPHVANYRLADDRHGGTGVTLVELRR